MKKTAYYRMSKGYGRGEIIKENPKTVLVTARKNTKVKVIKRHKTKHDVTLGV